MKKRILSILLAMCMLMSLLPVAAFATGGEDTKQQDETVQTQDEGNTPAESDGGEEKGEPTTPPAATQKEVTDVVRATLHDTAGGNSVPDSELMVDGYTVVVGTPSVDSAKKITTVPVTLTHPGLRAHNNAPSVQGFWVGFCVPAAEGNDYTSGWGTAPTDMAKVTFNGKVAAEDLDDGRIAFYPNATGKGDRGSFYAIVRSGTADNYTYVVYQTTLNVTRKIELDNSLTGYYWKTSDKPEALGGAIGDWRPQTILVALKDALPQNEHLWMEITAPSGALYGIAASNADKPAGVKYLAFSFLTQSQFEMWPKDQAVGPELGNYTLKLYEVPNSLLGDAGSVTASPTNKTLLATKTISVTSPLPAATVGYTSLADTTIVGDCVAKTMYVRFANAVPNNTYLWFEITDPDDNVYEIGANAEDDETKFAWSFTNQGQFEKWPDGVAAGTVTSGAYTVKAYLSPDKITEAHKVSGKPAGCVELWTKTVEVSDTAVVTPAPTQPTLSDSIKEEDKAAVTAAASSIKVESPAALANAAQDKANEAGQINEDTAKNALTSSNVNIGNKDVTVVVQPYLAVEAQAYDANTRTLVVDITAMSRTVATTANVENNEEIKLAGEGVSDANAAIIGNATPLTVNDPITLSIQLPDGFAVAKAGYNDIFVKHTKDGKAHYHKAAVVAGTGENASKQYATFVSTDGLSPFEISANAAAPEVAIGDTYYTLLQDAINAVTGGETITLGAGFSISSETASYTLTGTNKSFTIDKTSATGLTDAGLAKLLAALKAGGAADAVVSEDGNIITVTATVDSTTPENPGNNNNNGSSGGGSSSSVSVPSASNGKVTVSNNNAKKGDTVTITLTPNTGYVVDTVTVTDSKGNTITVTKTDDTHYTFVMPEGRVTVKATFKQADAPTDGFTDVAADAYYADAVKWAVDKGITNGLTATTFGPNNSCTRGQMVTFLWRAAGSPAATGTNSFTDVASGEYYYNAVLWAVEKGITNGTTATTFSPNATVNRGQTVTFLYRYAESPAVTGDSAFTDVAADAYYADAVKWAVAEEITNGTSATTFAPASNCTRGQIVTFLYRQMAE